MGGLGELVVSLKRRRASSPGPFSYEEKGGREFLLFGKSPFQSLLLPNRTPSKSLSSQERDLGRGNAVP
ncbi:MAG: hypothetical protein AAGA46_03845 [Cyanobacteria bacterium P01_F01_bin.13]